MIRGYASEVIKLRIVGFKKFDGALRAVGSTDIVAPDFNPGLR